MASLEERFLGKKVYIEANLYSSGKEFRDQQTIMYNGIFRGVQELGGRAMHVLEDVEYFTASFRSWNDSNQGGRKDETYVWTELLAVPVDSILSICLERDPKKSAITN